MSELSPIERHNCWVELQRAKTCRINLHGWVFIAPVTSQLESAISDRTRIAAGIRPFGQGEFTATIYWAAYLPVCFHLSQLH